MHLTPTTRLEAINYILGAVGEAPVNTLESGLSEADMAETLLHEINKGVQSKGWTFNTEINYELLPNLSGEVKLPTNTIAVDSVSLRRNNEGDLVLRGDRIYDRIKHTFNLGKSVKTTLTLLLDFEDLPESARRYITLRTARVFQDRFLGSVSAANGLARPLTIDEQEAWADLQHAESEAGDYNIFDNDDTYAVIYR